jgi:rhodanese-related sulfurtransferase
MTPLDVSEALLAKEILLIDVREVSEFQAERIAGAINHPLSSLSAQALPKPAQDQKLVFSCAGGVRSLKAVEICRAQGLEVTAHLAGGINAWKANGLSTQS